MEMLLLAMVLGWVVKNGVKDLVHTGATAVCAVQGKPAPTWGSKRRMSRPNGAATRYFSQLWNDSWEDALARHNARNARRDVAGPADPGTATRSFLGGNLRGGLRFAHRKWHAAWIRLKILRNLKKKDRPRPGQDTVPGEVVPNEDGGRDERRDRPQDETEDRPRPEPTPVPDEDEDEPSSRDEDQDEEPPSCPKCGTTMTTAPNIGDPMSYDGKGIYRCPSCDYKIRRSPEPTDDFTQEGPTTMTATTTEVVGLDSAIRFCEDSARAYRAQIQAIEQTQAALAAGDVTGPAAETFSQAMEQSNLAAASMDSAAAELLRHKQVQEAYLANQGAGTRDFILAGQ